MSARAIRYVETWIFNNVRSTPLPQENEKTARTYAGSCWATAVEAGISQEEIEEDFGEIGDLEIVILGEMDEPTTLYRGA